MVRTTSVSIQCPIIAPRFGAGVIEDKMAPFTALRNRLQPLRRIHIGADVRQFRTTGFRGDLADLALVQVDQPVGNSVHLADNALRRQSLPPRLAAPDLDDPLRG